MQSRNFQALTGIMQPGSALVMWRLRGQTGERLVVPPRPQYSWDGEQIGPEEATRLSGIPAIATDGLPALLDSLGARSTRVYLMEQDAGWPGVSRSLRAYMPDSAFIRSGGGRGRGGQPAAAAENPNEFGALQIAMNQARARKSDAEIALIERAAQMSVEGHKAAMRMVYPGVNESEIRGVFEGTVIRLGAERVGYPSIVGAGANATYLHYSADTMQSRPGDLVVMDAAAIYRGYSSDVTRTFPVSGTFSPAQRVIYEAVYAAHEAAASTLRPGSRLQSADSASRLELWKGLIKAGLADSVGATYVDARGRPASQLGLFYFHGLSHGLGLSVHDPTYTEQGAFVKNSIFVLEPGLYVRPMTLDIVADVPANAAYREKLKKALAAYSGIGARLEDNYVITDGGKRCLSCSAPRTIREIESIAGKSPIKR